MPSRALPNLGLQGFFDPGENGWDDEMSLNLLLLSVLVQGGVKEMVSATPGSPVNGEVYLFDESHPTQANKIAIRDDGAWVYATPLEGWRVYDRDANVLRLFNGTVWAEFSSGGGGGGSSPVQNVSGTSYTVSPDDEGNFITLSNGAAKTVTVDPDSTTPLPSSGEWHFCNTGAGDATFVEGSGVTISPPTGGTLVVPEGGTVTLKRIGSDSFRLIGLVNAV